MELLNFAYSAQEILFLKDTSNIKKIIIKNIKRLESLFLTCFNFRQYQLTNCYER